MSEHNPTYFMVSQKICNPVQFIMDGGLNELTYQLT